MGKVERQDACGWSAGSAEHMHQKNRSRLVLNVYPSTKASVPIHGNIRPTLEAEYCRREESRGITSSANRHSLRAVMLKFEDEDAEVVMAKALEGGRDSEKEETLIPEPMQIPAPREMEVKGSQVEKKLQVRNKMLALDKVKAIPSASLPAGQPNPVTPVLSSLGSPSAASRPREAFELLEEESPMKKAQAVR